jgi:hypothetical protein
VLQRPNSPGTERRRRRLFSFFFTGDVPTFQVQGRKKVEEVVVVEEKEDEGRGVLMLLHCHVRACVCVRARHTHTHTHTPPPHPLMRAMEAQQLHPRQA